MAVKRFRPVTSTQRFKTVSDFSILTKKSPYKKLTCGMSKSGGRNSSGRVTVRWRGGGHKRRYRIIDFKRSKFGIEGKVVSIEYDPNRNAYISLVSYLDGEKRYILAPEGLRVGMKIVSSKSAIQPNVGNALCLRDIPLGALVHNLELYPGKGGQMVRSAGAFARLLSKEGGYCNLRLPSGEVRKIFGACMATVGQVGNTSFEGVVLGKAGRKRWLGFRPRVRGVAMNPVDHPHGGGEGKTSGGRHPVSPWGQPAKGYKTRKLKKRSSKMIISKK